MWELGNYAAVAELIAGMGRDLVAAADVQPGHRVLDVGAGTGNAAVPAAKTGASVVALDPTPELLAVGERLAGGLPIDWVEGSAERLPYSDATFDVVLSCVGAMFAEDRQATARELVRVCRPGGTIAMANWTPTGGAGQFFTMLGRYLPPPTGPLPTRWGEPAYARTLFPGLPVRTEERIVQLDFTGTPAELTEFYRSSFAPVIATRAGLDSPTAQESLDRDLLELLTSEGGSAVDEPGCWRFPWLLVRVTP